MEKNGVEEAIDKIRHVLQADGGDVELVNITDEGVVEVRLKGACDGCPMATLTIKNGIERTLKDEFPELKEVKAVE